MMTRRSLAVMSANEGSVLVVYQRARARCSATSAVAVPAVAYQTVTRLRQTRPKGTVRSTARGTRLRVWVPKTPSKGCDLQVLGCGCGLPVGCVRVIHRVVASALPGAHGRVRSRSAAAD